MKVKRTLRKTSIRYWSIKLPKDGMSYTDGNFPHYTREYLQKRGQALFELILNHVPAEIYNEVVRQIQTREPRLWAKSATTTPKSLQK